MCLQCTSKHPHEPPKWANHINSIADRVGNRSGQSDFSTRVRLRFLRLSRVQTLRYIVRPDSDRVRSLAFQSLVGPVYFKDLLGKSRVRLRVWSDSPIEMGSAQIKLKLGRFPFQWVVTPTSRLIGGPGAATPLTGIELI